MDIYIQSNGNMLGSVTEKREVETVSMVEVIIEAANNYARNLDTVCSQPKEFKL